MLSMRQTDIMGQIVNDTWGKSSTPKSPSSTLKVTMTSDNTLSFLYMTIVTFASEKSLHDQRRKLDGESAEIINKGAADIKKQFKDMAGETIKLKEVSSDDSLEITYFNQFTPLRRAYYRRRAVFQLG